MSSQLCITQALPSLMWRQQAGQTHSLARCALVTHDMTR